MLIRKCDLQVRLTSPAFLGNATQAAQWRTPPFKALLRQWWRVAYAAAHDFRVSVPNMRREEGVLFGHAWLKDDLTRDGSKTAGRKSAVRLRLRAPARQATAWTLGTQQGVAPLSAKDQSVGYAWFGLEDPSGRKPARWAIKPGGEEGARTLSVALPDSHGQQMETVIALVDAFGQIGSRSRGGWGSLLVDGVPHLPPARFGEFAQPLQACLANDWPLSLSSDGNGLCLWESRNTYRSWDQAMRVVAGERRRVRTVLKEGLGRDLRFVLGFADQGRTPSPLRWKLIERQNNALAIRVFAMPLGRSSYTGHGIDYDQLERAWRKVLDALDESGPLARTVPAQG